MTTTATEPIVPVEWYDDGDTDILPFGAAQDSDNQDDETAILGRLGARPPEYVRVGSDATRYARDNRTIGRAGLCLKWVRLMLNIASRYLDAKAAWLNGRERHRNSHPREGAPFFFEVGKHWHVTLAATGGMVWSTDVKVLGRADLVSIGALARMWNATPLGWDEYLNGVRCLPDGIILDASVIVFATRTKATYSHGKLLKKWVWAEVRNMKGHRRMNLLSGRLGGGFRTNAKLIQKKQGFHNPDGLLGVTSLRWLTKRHSTDADVVS